MPGKKVVSSFRDPSGFVFERDNILYRQVNKVYKDDFDLLMNSGLYNKLVEKGLLIRHSRVDVPAFDPGESYCIILPEKVGFISYPYEWCFSQIKDAARATLAIQKTAMDFGMSLKDCSAYNIQFHQARPVLIDTLSFKKYVPGQPWVAYRQFCQHFIAPLALMALKDVRLNQLLRVYLDGIPLDLAARLLPLRAYLFPHIHLHALSQHLFRNRQVRQTDCRIDKLSLLGLIDNLDAAVKRLRWNPRGTEWADYYDTIGYSSEAFEHKKKTVSGFLDGIKPVNGWDLGSNTGVFSRIAADKGINMVCFDNDPAAVEKNYMDCVSANRNNILPLVEDLTNPSPATGWLHDERCSFMQRGPVDVALALALIHHLAISANLNFDMIAEFMKKISRFLIIEFVPKNDPQVKRLLAAREDIFSGYNRSGFEDSFSRHFLIRDSVELRDSERVMYLMENRGTADG